MPRYLADASLDSLMARFHATRRTPLVRGQWVAGASPDQREQFIRADPQLADRHLDTTQLSVHELRSTFCRRPIRTTRPEARDSLMSLALNTARPRVDIWLTRGSCPIRIGRLSSECKPGETKRYKTF